MSFEEIICCRICKNTDLIIVFDLGNHVLGCRFPQKDEPDPISVPLILVKCNDENNTNCGLLQLKHNTSESELFLHQYGYRSGLNESMRNHLSNLVLEIESNINLKD